MVYKPLLAAAAVTAATSKGVKAPPPAGVGVALLPLGEPWKLGGTKDPKAVEFTGYRVLGVPDRISYSLSNNS